MHLASHASPYTQSTVSEETMFERFAHCARAAVDDASFEAGRCGDRRIGTEHLLIALLHDEALARLVGVDAATARYAADELDRAALAAVGLELGMFEPAARTAVSRHISLTPGAKAALKQTLTNATDEKARRLTSRHMLLALLDRHEPDPAAVLLANLAVDPREARQRVAACL